MHWVTKLSTFVSFHIVSREATIRHSISFRIQPTILSSSVGLYFDWRYMGSVALPVETITTRTFNVEAARLRAIDVGGNTDMTDGMSTPSSEAQSSTSYDSSSDCSSDKPCFSDDGEILDIDSPSVSSNSNDEEEGPEKARNIAVEIVAAQAAIRISAMENPCPVQRPNRPLVTIHPHQVTPSTKIKTETATVVIQA